MAKRSAFSRYATGLASVALATVIRVSLNPILGERFPYIFYFIALVFSAGTGGLGPGLAALAMSGLALRFLILKPMGSFWVMDPASEVGLWVYMIVGLAISTLGGFMWSARRRAEDSAEEAREKQVQLEREIVERKRAEAALREADLRKDDFLAVLAHELRNPLAPVRTALHLMKQPFANPSDFEAERSMAERQVVHLARLVDDLMDVSRISQGKIELRKETVDLGTILNQAIEASRGSLSERKLELTVDLPRERIRLEADPTRLEQVLDNLLSNAIKYTEVGGKIWISAERDRGDALVRVRDSGIGIEPEMLADIFGMFVQAGKRGSRAQGGLGIGLGLVKTLVELHGGVVTARSDGPGQGSLFEFRLPALPYDPSIDAPRQDPTPAPAPDRKTEVANPVSALPCRRILVVDDNEDAARTLARLLSRLHGQEVRVAYDGMSALETARDFRPELVLLDIGMPGMDGYEVVRQLRPTPEAQGTMFVALTGWGQESDRLRSREAGFDHHLVKPVDPETIKGLLTSMPV
ncbi:ATP-binding protein [Singulisphaera sp. PoT]|uniref:ATP-binding response regulator n=1 Tax=Singulisphaera sp. PoT TaxID=3411797 RepID=UPI003BF4FDBF